jgi:hypothetical protein
MVSILTGLILLSQKYALLGMRKRIAGYVHIAIVAKEQRNAVEPEKVCVVRNVVLDTMRWKAVSRWSGRHWPKCRVSFKSAEVMLMSMLWACTVG